MYRLLSISWSVSEISELAFYFTEYVLVENNDNVQMSMEKNCLGTEFSF